MTGLPGKVEALLEHLLERVDAAAPGWLDGLYIIGSLALEDFHTTKSDIDFVGSTTRDLTSVEVGLLMDAYTELRAAHTFTLDGLFIPTSHLAEPPMPEMPVATCDAQGFSVAPSFLVNPVTWLSLATARIVVRGVDPTPWGDDAVTAQWCRHNLATYWRNLARSLRSGFLEPDPASRHSSDVFAWLVLGPPRLHCTITTGSIISKTSAAGYASQMFDLDWIDVVAAARAARLGQIETVTAAQMLTGCDFVDMVIDDAVDGVDRSNIG